MAHFVVLVSNRCGVLARVTSIISSTSANIQSCRVTEIPGSATSVLALHVQSSDLQTRAIRRKLGRLIEVIEVQCDEDECSDAGRLQDLLGFFQMQPCLEIPA